VEEASGPDTIDPAVCNTIEATEVCLQVYQPLITLGPNNTIIPVLATNYTASQDGKTYNFSLRQGVTFSNGDPFNAYTEWYTVYRTAIMEQEPSGYITSYLNTSGVTPDMLNQFNTANNVPPASLMQVMENKSLAVTVLGPYELQFHLKAPSGSFLDTCLVNNAVYVVDPRVVSQNGGVQTNATNTWMASNAVGTGPFVVSSFQPNTETVLQRNPRYWGGANGIQPVPKLSQVIIKVVPDDLTRLLDVQKGAAQLTLIPFDLVSQATSSKSDYIPPIGTSGSINYLGMDMWKSPMNNSLVRQAIVHAINETAVLQLFHGLATTFVGPVIHGSLGYNDSVQPPAYNVTLAKQLLAQAGYPGGQGLPTLTMVVPNNRPPAVDAAQVIEQNLASIGINVQLQEVAAAQRNQLIANTAPTDPAYPDLQYMTVAGPPDPDNWVLPIVGPNGRGVGVFNSAQYTNPQVDALVQQQSLTANATQRALLEGQIISLVNKDLPTTG
jgi:peptide/nickel transport system substrate-binding protein